MVGHSFGGVISQEIAAIRSISKIVLISSIKSRQELPMQFKIMKPLQIHKLFSKELTSKTIKLWGKSNDYETPEHQQLVKDMVNKQSNNYLQWALKELSSWEKPKTKLPKIVHIHGDSDKTFPIKLIQQPNHVIKNGGHFMIYKHAKRINDLLEAELS